MSLRTPPKGSDCLPSTAWRIGWSGTAAISCFDTGQGGALKSNLAADGASGRIVLIRLFSATVTSTIRAGLADALGERSAGQSDASSGRPGQEVSPRIGTGRHAKSVCPFPARKALHKPTVELQTSEGPAEIADGLMTTGKVPLVNDFEKPSSRFFVDEACSTPDHLPDDQSIFFEGDEGTVVLLGCAHSGVINTLQHVSQLTNERPIQAVIGGMHLVDASQERIYQTIEGLAAVGSQASCPSPLHGDAGHRGHVERLSRRSSLPVTWAASSPSHVSELELATTHRFGRQNMRSLRCQALHAGIAGIRAAGAQAGACLCCIVGGQQGTQ